MVDGFIFLVMFALTGQMMFTIISIIISMILFITLLELETRYFNKNNKKDNTSIDNS